jgi:hypothetical protein
MATYDIYLPQQDAPVRINADRLELAYQCFKSAYGDNYSDREIQFVVAGVLVSAEALRALGLL